MLRLTSTLVPSALGAIPSPRILSRAITHYAFNVTQYIVVKSDRKYPNCISRNFSTEAKKQLLDRKLVKFLKSKIKSKQLSLEKNKPSIPANFPFTIQNHPNWLSDPDWQFALTLKSELNGEKIEVSVVEPPAWHFISDDDSDDNGSDGDDDNCSSTESDSNEQKEIYHADLGPSIMQIVKIYKENGKEMEFSVASAEEIQIDSMVVKEPAAESESLICYGRGVRDSDLQFALREFLEIRGIKKSYVNFLFEYMAWNNKLIDNVYSYEGLKLRNKFIKA